MEKVWAEFLGELRYESSGAKYFSRSWNEWNVLDTETSLLVGISVLLVGVLVSVSGEMFGFAYYCIIFNLREKQAVLMIENCWCSYRDRHMYHILRTAVSSAVSCFSYIWALYE